METEIPEWIETIGAYINFFGVGIIFFGIVFVTSRFIWRYVQKQMDSNFQMYRKELGRVLLLGLEILVAADIIETVATEPDLASVASLAILVIIRTFLSWTLELEIEGRWPWQPKRE